MTSQYLASYELIRSFFFLLFFFYRGDNLQVLHTPNIFIYLRKVYAMNDKTWRMEKEKYVVDNNV